ncbi:MAG TPA: transporter [Polyangiales bacterium]|nr:transporter [Polyangiales bacterium]
MKRYVKSCLCAGLFWLAQTGTLAAQSYHLFNPVPRERMREMSTDRPDTTESPHTVDAGHVQIEMDPIVLSYDRGPSHRRTEFAVAATNMKAGLLPFMDLQVVLEPYHHSELEPMAEDAVTGDPIVDDGYGATTVRLKMNVWGNDEGSTAFALMPFVSHDDGVTDFGLIAPIGGDLPGDFGYGLMLEGDVVTIDDEGQRGFELVATATLGHDIIGPLGGYVEVASMYAAYQADQSTLALDAGLTLGLLDDLQLDSGARVGAAGPIDDVQVFAGLSARL